MAVSNPVVDDNETDAAAVTSGSSFYLAMRILPAEQRDAMFQVYAFCRAVDDIADEGGARRVREARRGRGRGELLAKLGRRAEAKADGLLAADMTLNAREREMLLARATQR